MRGYAARGRRAGLTPRRRVVERAAPGARCDRGLPVYAAAGAAGSIERAMIRILVVDDHPVLRAGLEAVLRAEPGFVCVGVAADGSTMTEAMRRATPDGSVLDRRLGVEDGLALCAALRERAGAPEVVIYTADASADMTARARAAGAPGPRKKGGGGG